MAEEEQIFEIQGIKKQEADNLYKRMVEDHVDFYRKEATILDCGSGVGAFSLLTALRLEAKAVYAFEGYHVSFGVLMNNRNNNSAQVLLPDDHHITGATGRSVMGVASGVTNALGLGEKYLIETRSIDDLTLPHLDYIRATVPGAAPAVIRGGLNRIREDKPGIVAEIISNRERSDILSLLEPFGYSDIAEADFRKLENTGTKLLFLIRRE